MTSLAHYIYIFLLTMGLSQASLPISDIKQDQQINYFAAVSPATDMKVSYQFTPLKEAIGIWKETFKTYINNIRLQLDTVNLTSQSYEDEDNFGDFYSVEDALKLDANKSYDCREFTFKILERGRDMGFASVIESRYKFNGSHFSVGSIIIDKYFQKKGYGTKIMQILSQKLDNIDAFNCQTINLHVGSDNKKAALVYARAGFWPYEYDSTETTLIPFSVTQAANFFFNQVSYQSQNPPKILMGHDEPCPQLMLRHKNAHTIALRGKDSCSDIITVLNQSCRVVDTVTAEQ